MEVGRFDGDLEIVQAWRDGLAPEPALLVSEWADRHRVFGSRESAEPGPFAPLARLICARSWTRCRRRIRRAVSCS
jgi:phage terminase large subunit GpA-like protein